MPLGETGYGRLKKMGDMHGKPQEIATTSGTGQCALLTDSLDLTNLPDKLDAETLARVEAISRSPLPELPPCDNQTFAQALRMMLAVLPKRHLDELSGELLVAAYRESLGRYPAQAIDYLRRDAINHCKWFPTIAECHEILGKWRRRDEFTQRKSQATSILHEQIVRPSAWRTPDGEIWKPKPGELERIKSEAAEAVKARG